MLVLRGSKSIKCVLFGVVNPDTVSHSFWYLLDSLIQFLSFFRPDILKHEIKAFFVKYNDPIYVKLEKLDIMIRLASQQNIGQVLAELKE